MWGQAGKASASGWHRLTLRPAGTSSLCALPGRGDLLLGSLPSPEPLSATAVSQPYDVVTRGCMCQSPPCEVPTTASCS